MLCRAKNYFPGPWVFFRHRIWACFSKVLFPLHSLPFAFIGNLLTVFFRSLAATANPFDYNETFVMEVWGINRVILPLLLFPYFHSGWLFVTQLNKSHLQGQVDGVKEQIWVFIFSTAHLTLSVSFSCISSSGSRTRAPSWTTSLPEVVGCLLLAPSTSGNSTLCFPQWCLIFGSGGLGWWKIKILYLYSSHLIKRTLHWSVKQSCQNRTVNEAWHWTPTEQAMRARQRLHERSTGQTSFILARTILSRLV